MKPSCLYFHVILAAYYVVQRGSKDLNVKSTNKRVTCGHVAKLRLFRVMNALSLFNTAKLASFAQLCTKSQAILILHTNGKLPSTGIHSAKRNLSYLLYIFFIFYAKPPLPSRFQPSLIKQINLESQR